MKLMPRHSRIVWLLTALLFASGLPGLTAQTSAAQSRSPDTLDILRREISRLASVSGGTVGVGAVHIETGRRVSLNGIERFPMASSYKVPIAVELLHRIDLGQLTLDQMVAIKQSDLHPGSGTLTDLFNKPGLSLSIRNLLELMMLISDNSATDILLRMSGGGQAVTARVRALGIDGINVDRPTALLISDWLGVASLPEESDWTIEGFRTAFSQVKPEERETAAKKFDVDPRDTSTPDSMADLLVRIHRKDLLKSESAELLLDIMRRCRTGEARLKGILPEGTVVAHKTGTIGGTTNDVGIVTLPDGAGHVAIAVFVKSSSKPVPARERAIAEIARAVHDFFLFHPS